MSEKNTPIGHPMQRLRRLRQSEALRSMVADTVLNKSDLICPVFVTEINTERTPIASLPGVERIPLAELAAEAKRIQELGLKSVLLFPVVDAAKKTTDGREAFNPNGILQQAIRTVRAAAPELIVFADVALDPFTSHGHDGVLSTDGQILNDPTVAALMKMSVTLAEAGVHFVAPSDMMDGRIAAIREQLDKSHFENVGILAYSAKYASAFYGPFREAVGSGARGLDKKTYQLNYANVREALLEAQYDEDEGADMLMVKPGLCYLDILCRIRQQSHKPLVMYHVSGEYAMLKAAVEKDWLDEKPAVYETLLSMKRAGADLIVTYYAQWAAAHLFL
ncbi:MAG: porphobilinogen synthase [Betaproteobacteria bacterium]|nr:porphobilinogen synthase [Betaproteobacteria bacterium]